MAVICTVTALISVTNAITASVDARLKEAIPIVSQARFINYPGAANRDQFVVNTNFFFRGVDFSCASPWNSTYGQLRAGTLVSKRHFICAKHFPLTKGTRILFVDDEARYCPCRVNGIRFIEDSDIAVGVLDYEVTPNIIPAKILPEDYQSHIGLGWGLPVLTFNCREQLSVADIYSFPTNSTWRFYGCVKSTDRLREKFYIPIEKGDSGNPAFLIVDNRPILLYCLTTGGGGAGYPIHKFRRQIQAAMDELCPGYKLETFDFNALTQSQPDK